MFKIATGGSRARRLPGRPADVQVKIYGKGGSTVVKEHEHMLKYHRSEVDAFEPDILCMQIGANDVGKVDPTVIAEAVIAEAIHHLSKGVKHILIRLLVRRHPPAVTPAYARHYSKVNEVISRMCYLTKSLTFVKHPNILSSRAKYLKDGCHFNGCGNKLFAKSWREAITKLLKSPY